MPVHEAGLNERGEVFYTMKFVKGTTLRQVLRELGDGDFAARARHPLEELLTVFQKVCDAVAFAHARGVIHRDLKPENIMLGDFGEVLVMDWGVAKVISPSDPHRPTAPSPPSSPDLMAGAGGEFAEVVTMAGTVLGTPHYMSPEQARGEVTSLDARSDIFALGAILFELLTLQHAIAGESAPQILANAAAGRHAAVPEELYVPHAPAGRVPAALLAVAQKAMARDPAARYATVPELQAEIARYQNGFATLAENAGFGRQLALLVRRHRGIALTAAAAWLVLTALGVWFVLNVTRERDRAEQALTELRNTVPIFLAQARSLATAQKSEEALRTIDAAIALENARGELHEVRGRILQTLQRFGDAQESFERAARFDPSLPHLDANIALSRRLHEAIRLRGDLAHDDRQHLLDSYRQQHRFGDALPIATQLQKDSRELLPMVRERIHNWIGKDPPDLTVTSVGELSLSLNKLPITDIEPLRGLPLGALDLTSTRVTNLAPLAGMRLTRFEYYSGGEATDLSPLRDMPIRRFAMQDRQLLEDVSPVANSMLIELIVEGCKVRDISAFRGCPLERVELNETLVRDHAPLRGMKLRRLSVSPYFSDPSVLKGMPLRQLSLNWADSITNVEFLAEFTDLDELVLPPRPGRIDFLRQMPKLRLLSGGAKRNGWDHLTTAEEFWADCDGRPLEPNPEPDPLAEIRARLRQGGAPQKTVDSAVLTASGLVNLSFKDTCPPTIDYLSGLRIGHLDIVRSSITNLAMLDGYHIEGLEMSSQPVSNLTPLSGHTELRDLRTADTKVSDLTPILGLPLRTIYLARTKVKDVSPLAAMTTLEVIELPEGAAGIEKLRALPNLRRISYRWDRERKQVAQTASEFWAEFDAKTSP